MGIALSLLRRLAPGPGSERRWDWRAFSAPALWRALESVFLREQHRWALWLPVGLAIGIAIYFGLPFEPSLALGIFIAGSAICATIGASFDLHPMLRASIAMLAAGLVGFTAAKIRTEMVRAPVIAHKIGAMHFEGRLEVVELRDKGARVTLGELSGARFGDVTPAHVRVTLKTQTTPLKPGDWVQLTAVLMPPPSPAMPGDYDFGRRAYFEGLGAVGYAFGEAKPAAPQREAAFLETVSARLEQLRNAMTARIRAVLPGPEGAISAALITGDQSRVDPSDVSAYRDSGLTHVLSISGLHLALAGGIFFWVIRALFALFPSIALNYPIKKWAAVGALGGATFYLLISGCEAPAVRSWIMLAMMFFAILVDRAAITMRTVALSAGVILLFSPESLVAPGFEMSFAAVIGLVAFGEWEMSRERDTDAPLGWLRRVWRYFSGIAIASIVAGLATAPFVIFHFDRSAQFGIVSNLLSLPIASFVIMPAATAAMVLMPLGLERLPLLVMGKGVEMMSAVAHWTASLPGAASVLPAWPMAALLLVVVGGLWISLWRERWRWLGVISIAFGILVAVMARAPDLLIGRDGTTVAVRLPDGLLGFVVEPKDKFAAEAWLKRDGDERLPEAAMASRREGVKCDALGCTAHSNGALIAITLRDEALAEDCARAAVVVSAIPARGRCRGPRLVVDRFDVLHNGAYAVWLSRGIDVQTVQNTRGDRPWSQPPRGSSYQQTQ